MTAIDTQPLTIAARFNGPPQSGNGGYCCGAVAAWIDGPAHVSLKAPPPLETPLNVTRDGAEVRVRHSDQPIATATPAPAPALTPPARPTWEEARRAADGFAGFERHVFPTCFVCGPERAVGDGLRIFPGPLADGTAVAAPWTPDASLAAAGADAIAAPHVWAALDCPSYFAFQNNTLAALLASMTAAVRRTPRVGEACVIVAWPQGSDGRKHRSASVIFGEDGAAIADASALWIEMRPETRAAVGAG